MYTGLIWFQGTTRDVRSKMTPPFFKVTDATRVHGSPQQVWLPLSERHSMQRWLVERTRVWRVYSATPAAGHRWAGVVLATHCPKIDGSQIWRVGSKKSVMTRALWVVALLSCKVWHLVPWLAEHVGWGGTQSHPCSVGQLGSPEWRRVAFYHWGGYMLTHIITDLPP